jgi:hypothetical protein
LYHFRPGNIGANRRANHRQDTEARDYGDQPAKSESTGPPIRISMGRRFHSYS